MSTTRIDQDIGSKIKQSRLATAMEIEPLAALTSLRPEDWEAIEAGTKRASASQLFEMVQVLEIDVKELFSEP